MVYVFFVTFPYALDCFIDKVMKTVYNNLRFICMIANFNKLVQGENVTWIK